MANNLGTRATGSHFGAMSDAEYARREVERLKEAESYGLSTASIQANTTRKRFCGCVQNFTETPMCEECRAEAHAVRFGSPASTCPAVPKSSDERKVCA